MSNVKFSVFIIMLMFVTNLQGQSYAKDSLQIKVYTQIKYINNKVVDIKLKKVFCDYCSDYQRKEMGYEGLRRANIEKYYPENRLENGIKKLALYIRIAKKDFSILKQDNKSNTVKSSR